MNTSIETLNHWGESFLGFAWPMLWQSSLLIVIVFALDMLLARKIRASVRHALWLVVLVKLLLPPALALPTGATWWLWPAKPPLAPVIRTETLMFDTTTLSESFPLETAPIAVPPPKLSGAAWTIIISGVVGAGLLLSLLFQWLKVERKTRNATATGDFANALESARQLACLRGPVRLRLVDDMISPAVYGLFRPVILLPRALAEKLSSTQLRAVLLHEAVHLRRGDVWVNCAQTLLQIFYWWHPLLWLANARIRRLREEAVDDAVMMALRGDADAYAPTLLEVAKFAFRRPLASLGLVGILESRSALRQRVERLVDFRPPRKAGVTFLSLCGIFLFGAVALPMGQAPASEPQFALTDGTNQFEMPASKVDTNPFTVEPPAPSGTVILTGTLTNPGVIITASPGRKAIYRKLNHIQLDTVSFQNLPLSEALRTLHEQSQLRDPDKTGINFVFAPPARQGTMINPATGLPETIPAATNTATAADIQINMTINNDVSLANVLDAICLGADHPIKYSIEDYGVVFTDKDPNTVQYEMRTIKVDPKRLLSALQETVAFPVRASDVTTLAKAYFQKQGVNLDPPKTIFFNEGLGRLFVNATPADLDVVERAVVALDDPLRAFRNVTTSSDVSDRKQAADAWEKVGKEFYEVGNLDEAGRDLEKALALDPDNQAAMYYQSLIQQIRTNATPDERMVANTGGAHILDEIKKIHLDALGPFDKAPLIAVVQELNRKVAQAGADFRVAFISPTPAAYDDASIFVTLPKLNNVSLREAFDLVAESASEPAKYMIMDDLVAFSPDTHVAAVSLNAGPRFDVEHYQIIGNTVLSPQTIDAVLTNVDGAYGTNVSFGVVRTVAEKLQEAYLDRGYHKVAVYLPQQKLTNGTVKIQVDEDRPQVHIKARFIEVPSSEPNNFGTTGILTSSEFRTLLHQLMKEKDVNELAEPECTTITGRQCEMRATHERQVVAGYELQPSGKPHVPAVVPQMLTNVEVGPICDVAPLVMADGYTINLKAIGSLIDFFGYADPNGLKDVTTNYEGNVIHLPMTLPAFLVSESTSQALLYDGQTLVMFPKAEQNPKAEELTYQPDEKWRERIAEHIRKAQKKKGDKTLVVFVTVTLIDAAGNRVHSDKDMSFAQNSVPRQPIDWSDSSPSGF